MTDPNMDIVIVAARRTPVGSFNGALSSLPAHELGAIAIRAALDDAGVDAADVDEVILGQVLQAGAGQGPARQAAVKAGVPVESPAWSLNQLCGSGLRAVALGYQQIAQGDAAIVVCGGQESMSQAPHAQNLRSGQKMGDLALVDTMIKDGLWDAFHGYHMGQTAENIASRWQITREDQDKFAVASQNKAEAAQKAGKFDGQIASVTIKGRKGDVVVDKDEYIRAGSTYEAMSGLKPAFNKEGSVTAGNASGLNDGAAAIVLDDRRGSQETGRRAPRPHRFLGQRGRGARNHGHGADPGLEKGAGESRLDRCRPRPDRIQRSLRRPVPLRGEGAWPRPRQGQRQRRRHRHRPPHRRVRRPHPHHPGA